MLSVCDVNQIVLGQDRYPDFSCMTMSWPLCCRMTIWWRVYQLYSTLCSRQRANIEACRLHIVIAVSILESIVSVLWYVPAEPAQALPWSAPQWLSGSSLLCFGLIVTWHNSFGWRKKSVALWLVCHGTQTAFCGPAVISLASQKRITSPAGKLKGASSWPAAANSWKNTQTFMQLAQGMNMAALTVKLRSKQATNWWQSLDP